MEVNNLSNRMISSHAILPLIILFEGFVSVAIEILTIRQLLPVVGGSVIVTSLIIGIFLLFLAIGYRQGGRIKDNLEEKLRFNFLLAAFWLGIGLSYLFIIFFFTFIEKLVGLYIVYQLIIYLLLILAPLIYILGQTVPITMNMVRKDKRVGTIGGDTLGISTIGSFFGAVFTALVLMQYMGVAWTIVINAGILVFLVLILSENAEQLAFNTFAAFTILWIVWDLNISTERNLFALTNNYANYQVLHPPTANLKSGEKILVINNSFSSFTGHERKGFSYIELIKKILFKDLKFRNKHILVLGAGGFTFSAENTYQNNITYIDIDKKIKQVVRTNFLSSIEGDFIDDDARHFVHTSKNKFDAIIVDAYSNLRSIPSYLLSYEFFHEMQTILQKNGVIILNVIARPTLSDLYSKRIDNTIRLALKNCTSTPAHYSNQPANIIYVCHANAVNDDTKIYSDNLNTATTDAFRWNDKL